ncbi:MAG: VOC family protein [bacterium]|nr:VOC family protein [bacterium]
MSDKPKIGSITWRDLTVPDAESIRDFYAQVVGWSSEPLDMGGYSDYTMTTPSGKQVAGICHARGGNADIPPEWLMYVTVIELNSSLDTCRELGGKIIAGPKTMAGMGRYAVIQDPAGAVLALWEAEG